MKQIMIRNEQNIDNKQIENLLESAFGKKRHQRTVYKYRKYTKKYDKLCYCAVNNNSNIVASIRFWLLSMPDGDNIPLLGPLVVVPAFRSKGLAIKLIDLTINKAKTLNFPAILIVGDPNYYTRFGFDENLCKNITMDGSVSPLTLMGIQFKNDYLTSKSGLIKPINDNII